MAVNLVRYRVDFDMVLAKEAEVSPFLPTGMQKWFLCFSGMV